MRTTLEIDNDVLLAVKELARRDGTTSGRMISNLLRQVLSQPATTTAARSGEPREVYGFRPFPSRGSMVTNEQVDELRNENVA